MILLLTCGPRFCHSVSELIPDFVAIRDGQPTMQNELQWPPETEVMECKYHWTSMTAGNICAAISSLATALLHWWVCWRGRGWWWSLKYTSLPQYLQNSIRKSPLTVYQMPFNPIMVTRLLNSFTKAHFLIHSSSSPTELFRCFTDGRCGRAFVSNFLDHPPHEQDALLRAEERKLGKLLCMCGWVIWLVVVPNK